MAQLSTGKRFGGIFLILIGVLFILGGVAAIMFGNVDIVNFVAMFFGGVQSAIFLVGIVNIILGLFLIWAGRTIRGESFV